MMAFASKQGPLMPLCICWRALKAGQLLAASHYSFLLMSCSASTGDGQHATPCPLLPMMTPAPPPALCTGWLPAQVLKALDTPFTPLVGQLVLEAFTFDEGTYPATACDFVAKTVFNERVGRPVHKGLLHAS